MVKTMFGRRRLVPELNSRNGQIRAAAERVTVNMPIQGTAADILKKAMIDLHTEEHGYVEIQPPLLVRRIAHVHELVNLKRLVDEVLGAVRERLAPRLRRGPREPGDLHDRPAGPFGDGLGGDATLPESCK